MDVLGKIGIITICVGVVSFFINPTIGKILCGIGLVLNAIWVIMLQFQ